MGPIEIIGVVLLCLISLFLIVVVMLQEGNAGNPSAVTGMADSYYEKNNTKTKEKILQSATKITTILFFVVTLALNTILLFVK